MFFLLLPLLVLAVDAQQPLPLNSVNTFTTSTSLFGLPASSQLTVSVAICVSEASSARFFLSNSPSVVPAPGGGTDVFEIQLTDGSGQWSGSAPSGGLLSVQDLQQGSFQIFVSDNGTTYQVLDQLPLLGDTTSNQTILFSHPFLPMPIAQPSFPNYTLPPANLAAPDIPSSIPNFTLVIAPASAQLSSLPQTACALLNAPSTGSIVGNDPWLRSSEGWRSQWLVDGLSPSTNYTAYVIQDALKVSGPIYFATKSGNFQCPLVYSLPYCPSTAYAVPLPPLPSRTFGYNATSLPDSIALPLLQYMTNFTTMLTTFACGRDLYSPLQTCADCQTHYRTWLCSISFPRCSEPAPGNNSTAASSSSLGTAAQVPLSALQPQPSGSLSRSPNFPNATYDYSSLLPCLETCNAVDRACPYFLGIKCPTAKFNAAESYGVGFIDSGNDDEIGNGITGLAQDRWGNVWCNGN
ncbi:stretch-activated Ca2+-permeable channel component-domain-containing protein [Boletus reticuloceps]|uniref:Stretch-activated Ca2+-permeable channel component-domain-containing protein n=1 Tax=Boletus reticuloceps TaxID=495285 RepID=A0A8I2YKQ5_9AGAM|nr:stretch-activated Ca2+-permeable channel component-domain-containing protein [Boletus reticuloceps]